jgi:hypothetical protein
MTIMRKCLIGAAAAVALLAPVVASAACLPSAIRGNWTLLATGALVDRYTGALQPTAWSCAFYATGVGGVDYVQHNPRCTDKDGVRGGVSEHVDFWDLRIEADCSTHPQMRFETWLTPQSGLGGSEAPFFCWVRGQMTQRKDMIVGVLDCRNDGAASFVMVRR